MTWLLVLLAAAVLSSGAFHVGRRYGSLLERASWEDKLAQLPPSSEESPPLLPENAGENGPYRTSEPPMIAVSAPLFNCHWPFVRSPIKLGLTDMFLSCRQYGAADPEIFFRQNPQILALLDLGHTLSELETYLSTRNDFRIELDELQQVFLALVRVRQSSADVDSIMQLLNGDISGYSMNYTLIKALGEIWPPTGDMIRLMKDYQKWRKNMNNQNQEAIEHIRQTATNILATWRQRDEALFIVTMCK
ncbi:MAG: hypothetical protein V1738_02860 [Patescibacteria group bacterium]